VAVCHPEPQCSTATEVEAAAAAAVGRWAAPVFAAEKADPGETEREW
jgi:hypothetical protein